MKRSRSTLLCLTTASLLSSGAPAFSTPFLLPGTTGGSNRIDLGAYQSGTELVVSCTGTISLLDPVDWYTLPDGSLAQPVQSMTYSYANVDATNYPMFAGGDGTNHYPGGGANVDTVSGSFGFAGAATTDTTDFDTIRFGAVVLTFSNNPNRNNWFLLENGVPIIVSGGEAARLSIAVNDFSPMDNGGEYECEINVVPEPASLTLCLMASAALFNRRRRSAIMMGR